MRFVLNIFILTLFCGCATLPPASFPDLRENRSLWHLKVRHHEKTLFSGLLTLEKKNENLQLAVLDDSGITVLTGRLDEQGEIEVYRCLAPARKHDFPDFLGPALARIFYRDIKRECFEKSGSIICRSGFPTLSLWTVRYFYNNINGATEILYSAPGADLILREIETTK